LRRRWGNRRRARPYFLYTDAEVLGDMTIGWKAVAAACGLLVITAPAANAADALVAQWRFDEPSGQVALDDGPYGLAGQLGTLGTQDPADPVRLAGGALRFDGASIVKLPASPALALQHMTIEAVVRAPQSPGTYRYVISRGAQGCYSGAWGLYTGAAGGIALYVFDGSRYYVSSIARPADVWNGAWHRVTGTYDGRWLRLFVDGRQIGDDFAAPPRIDYSTTTDGAAIGHYAGNCSLAYRGDLDLVAIASDAKGQSQAIDDARQGGTLPPDQPPTPLPAAAPGTTLAGPLGPAKPKSACTVTLSRTSVVARRRTVVRAHVGLSKVTVTARRSSRGKPLAHARTGASGSARLVVKAPRTGTITVGVAGRASCSAARLRVVAR
jgi:hypothetical protein